MIGECVDCYWFGEFEVLDGVVVVLLVIGVFVVLMYGEFV